MDDIKPQRIEPTTPPINDVGPRAPSDGDKDSVLGDLDISLPDASSAPTEPAKPKAKSSTNLVGGLIGLGIIIVILGVGGWLGYKYVIAGPIKPSNANVVQLDPPKPGSTRFESKTFGLNIDYPKAWKADPSSGDLRIISPAENLTDASGQAISAKIILSVEPTGTIPEAFRANGAVAVLPSEKIAYDQPSQVQRAETYVSFVQYRTTSEKGGLDAIYVTGDSGYKSSQYIPESDVNAFAPLITVTFGQCSGNNCSDFSPVILSSSAWQASPAKQSVDAMLKSIRVHPPGVN